MGHGLLFQVAKKCSPWAGNEKILGSRKLLKQLIGVQK